LGAPHLASKRQLKYKEMEEATTLFNGGPPKVTSECPPPPFYWAIDNLQSVLQPPPLPANMDFDAHLAGLEGEYSGVVRTLRRTHRFDSSKNYKVVLIELLQKLLDKALSIASYVPQIPSPPQGAPSAVAQHEALAQLNEILVQMHDALGEYRTHEARETIIKIYKAELSRLETLESSILRVTAETS